MARGIRRGVDEAAREIGDGENKRPISEDLQHLAGPFGPWVKDDRIEFHHLCREAQELWVRMSPEDVQDFKDAVSDFVTRKIIKKWLLRIFWAATTGFGAVYVAGERLLKFVQAIGGFGLDLTSIGRVLKGLVGL